MKRHARWARLALLSCAAMLGGRPALRAESEATLNEVVVHGERDDAKSATKTDAPLIDTPQSISVVTQDQIRRQGAVQTVEQALRYTPGMTVESGGADTRFDGPCSRGFSMDEYLDGLKILQGVFWPLPQVDPYNLDRIEVIKGPASALYGQVSPGGLLNMVSKRPPEDFGGEVSLQAGSYGRRYGAFDVGGPLTAGKTVLYRLTALSYKTGSQVDFTKYERTAVSPAVTWRPSDKTSLTVLASYQHDPQAGFYNFLPYPGMITPNPNGRVSSRFFGGEPDHEMFDRKQLLAGYQFSHAFSDAWTVRQNLRYTRSSAFYDMVYNWQLEPDMRTLDRDSFLDKATLDTLTVDNQAQWKGETGAVRHTVLAGADYQRDHGAEVMGDEPAPTLDLFNPVYGQPISDPVISVSDVQRDHQFGLYAQDQARIDRWNLLVSVRNDWASQKSRDRIAETDAKQSNNAFTERVGLLYAFDAGFSPYASYSESFQPTIGTDFFGKQFRPTKGRQEEAGVKYQPKSFDGFITAAVYNLTQTNVLTTDLDHLTYTTQTGEVRSRGVELEGRLKPVPSLQLVAAYAFLDSKVTKSNNGNEGKKQSSFPAHMASFSPSYTVLNGALAGFGVGGGVRYTGTAFANSDNSVEVPAWTVFDAEAHYDFGARNNGKGLRVALNVANVSDKVYVVGANDGGSYYGLRRDVKLTTTYKF